MLYKSLNTLKVIDIYNIELGKFMHQLENNKLSFIRFVVPTKCKTASACVMHNATGGTL